MTQFNIQRMKQYAQWQLASHRAILLKITGVVTSIFILKYFFINFATDWDLRSQGDDLSILWIACFAFCGVFVFPNLSSKQNRTSLLMLPASNAEKFVTSYIGVLLTCFFVPLVSFIAADMIQWVLSLAIDYKEAVLLTPLALSKTFRLLSHFGGENWWMSWVAIPNVLWFHSFYLLSGLFFKKYRWLWGTITQGALVTLATSTIALGGFLFLDRLKDSDYGIEILPWAGDALAYATSIFFLLLTVLNYWLSFRIFKRLQVINNRFFNW